MSAGIKFKYLAARMAQEDPARFLSTFEGDGGHAYLCDLYCGVSAAEYPPDEFGVERHGQVLVLRLPSPHEPNAPFAIAVAGDASALRVFVLEKSGQPPVRAFLAEIGARHRANFGPIEETSCAALARRVAEIVASSEP